MSAEIRKFEGQKCPIFFASREVVTWRKRECERWVVITLHPDGNSEWHGPLKSRKEAEWLANVLAEAHYKNRMKDDEQPLLAAINRLPVEYREMMRDAIRLQFGRGPA